jgi:phage baseplate assembly protein V
MEPRAPFLVGRVSDRNPEKATVRVTFPGLAGLTSWWLPVLYAKTLDDQLVWLPDIGEHVLCLFDRHAEFGAVLGAMYSATTPPPVVDGDKAHIKFKDGTTIEYDRALHKLAIAMVADDADVEVTVTGNVTINVPDGKHVVLGGPGAEQLATIAHVERYLGHTHPTPSGLSGAPIDDGTALDFPDVTERAVGR